MAPGPRSNNLKVSRVTQNLHSIVPADCIDPSAIRGNQNDFPHLCEYRRSTSPAALPRRASTSPRTRRGYRRCRLSRAHKQHGEHGHYRRDRACDDRVAASARALLGRMHDSIAGDELIHAYRTSHVLESSPAEILEAGARLVADFVVDVRRDADAAGRGERVNPRRDVDAVAEHGV